MMLTAWGRDRRFARRGGVLVAAVRGCARARVWWRSRR
jgi:hypothetical protein